MKNYKPMNWSNDNIFEFLEAYSNEPCIWDPRHVMHRNRVEVNEAWNRIYMTLSFELPVSELKKKKDSLMAAYRSLQSKQKRTADSEEPFKPKWFAFDIMDKFLGPMYSANANEEAMNEDGAEDNSNLDISQWIKTEIHVDDSPEAQIDVSGNWSPKNRPPPLKRRRPPPQESNVTNEKRTNEDSNNKEPSDQADKSETRHDEDECDLYARLLAKRLRKFDEVRREIIMNNIDNFVFQENMVNRFGVTTRTVNSFPTQPNVFPATPGTFPASVIITSVNTPSTDSNAT